MLRYFPDPYPDESIYSILVRYAAVYGYVKHEEILRDLYGNSCNGRKINLVLGIQLDDLFRDLPVNYRYNMQYFIENHSIIPIYKPFITEEEYRMLVYNIKHNMSSAFNRVRGNNTLRIRYCDQCIEEDREKYGNAYLHRQHQLNGVLICIKHNTLLKNIERRKEIKEIINIDRIDLENNYKIARELSNEDLNIAYQIAVQIDILFKESNKMGDRKSTIQKYIIALSGNGFMMKEKVNTKAIVSILRSTYKKSYFEEVKWRGFTNTDNISRISTQSVITKDPVQNIMFMYSIFNKIIDLKHQPTNEDNYDNFEVKKGLAVKEYYRKSLFEILSKNPKIMRAEIFHQYFVVYAWLKENDRQWFEENMPRPRNNIYLKKAEKYKKQLLNIIEEHPELSRTQIYHKINTAYAYLKKIDNDFLQENLPRPHNKIGIVSEERKIRNNISRESEEEKIKRHRDTVIRIVSENPNWSRTQVRDKKPSAYCWLQKNDIEWFEKHLPISKKFRKGEGLEVCREELLSIRRTEPDLTRTLIRLKHKRIYEWLERNDREWLQKHLPPSRFEKANFNELREEYRDRFHSFVKHQPEENRSKIRKQISKVYCWLKKNDGIWLEKHLNKKYFRR